MQPNTHILKVIAVDAKMQRESQFSHSLQLNTIKDGRKLKFESETAKEKKTKKLVAVFLNDKVQQTYFYFFPVLL